jgi:MFS family permease
MVGRTDDYEARPLVAMEDLGAARLSSRTIRSRNLAVTLLVIAGCVNYLDRSAVSVGDPEITRSLGFSYSAMGLLLSAFAWSYGFAQIPAGIAVDKFGARKTIGAGMLLWSLAQISAGFVASLPQFLAARVALGFGESPMYIGGTRVCADWFELKARALPIAIFNSSSALAPALAPPLLTALMLAFGWHAMFILAGLAGLAVAIAWVVLYRSPVEAEVAPEELARIHAGDSPDIAHVGIRQVFWLLRFRTTWGMFLGFFGVIYVYWLYATWLPGYLETERHLSIASAGVVSAIPLAAGFFGSVSGGVFSDRLGRKIDVATACRIPAIVGLVVTGIVVMAAAHTPSTWLAVTFISIGLFAINVSSSSGWALAAVVSPSNTVATLDAVQNIGGSLGGALAPLVTGALVQVAGSFRPAFDVASAIAFMSAACYFTMTRKQIRV